MRRRRDECPDWCTRNHRRLGEHRGWPEKVRRPAGTLIVTRLMVDGRERVELWAVSWLPYEQIMAELVG